jgi:integrase
MSCEELGVDDLLFEKRLKPNQTKAEQLKLVSEMLGRASVKYTADTYTHVSPTMHREAAMRLNDFLSGHLK